jgi:hypothetical protein
MHPCLWILETDLPYFFLSNLFDMAYRNSAGFVYLRFETVEGAMAAQSAMHLRWFARRLISALFMVMY